VDVWRSTVAPPGFESIGEELFGVPARLLGGCFELGCLA
jgi:hypothetical protein